MELLSSSLLVKLMKCPFLCEKSDISCHRSERLRLWYSTPSELLLESSIETKSCSLDYRDTKWTKEDKWERPNLRPTLRDFCRRLFVWRRFLFSSVLRQLGNGTWCIFWVFLSLLSLDVMFVKKKHALNSVCRSKRSSDHWNCAKISVLESLFDPETSLFMSSKCVFKSTNALPQLASLFSSFRWILGLNWQKRIRL